MIIRALFFLFCFGFPCLSYAQCVAKFSKELTFSDGSKACLEEFEPLNLDVGTNIAAQARRAITFSYAIPAPDSKCIASSGWSSNSRDDDQRAIAFCEEAAKKKAGKDGLEDYRSCKCVAIAPVNGNVGMTQKDFVSLLFRNSYALLDQHSSSLLFGSKIRDTKKVLEEKEQLHYARLAKLDSAKATPAPETQRSYELTKAQTAAEELKHSAAKQEADVSTADKTPPVAEITTPLSPQNLESPFPRREATQERNAPSAPLRAKDSKFEQQQIQTRPMPVVAETAPPLVKALEQTPVAHEEPSGSAGSDWEAFVRKQWDMILAIYVAVVGALVWRVQRGFDSRWKLIVSKTALFTLALPLMVIWLVFKGMWRFRREILQSMFAGGGVQNHQPTQSAQASSLQIDETVNIEIQDVGGGAWKKMTTAPNNPNAIAIAFRNLRQNTSIKKIRAIGSRTGQLYDMQ